MIFARFRKALPCLAAALAAGACASAPSPTEASIELAKNAKASIEGRVVSDRGDPVAGISVYGLPHGRDIPWSPPAITDSEGRFLLTVFAPAEYGFLLRSEGRTVITPRSDDPARLAVTVAPGQRRTGIELMFLREQWKEAG